MPIPAALLYPTFNIVRLSHVEYRERDLSASRTLYGDTLGTQVTDGNAIYLRAMEERGHHCIILTQSDATNVARPGFKLHDQRDLDKAADLFAAQGQPTAWITRPFMGAFCKPVTRGACR